MNLGVSCGQLKQFCICILEQHEREGFNGQIDWIDVKDKFSNVVEGFCEFKCKALWNYLSFGEKISEPFDPSTVSLADSMPEGFFHPLSAIKMFKEASSAVNKITSTPNDHQIDKNIGKTLVNHRVLKAKAVSPPAKHFVKFFVPESLNKGVPSFQSLVFNDGKVFQQSLHAKRMAGGASVTKSNESCSGIVAPVSKRHKDNKPNVSTTTTTTTTVLKAEVLPSANEEQPLQQRVPRKRGPKSGPRIRQPYHTKAKKMLEQKEIEKKLTSSTSSSTIAPSSMDATKLLVNQWEGGYKGSSKSATTTSLTQAKSLPSFVRILPSPPSSSSSSSSFPFEALAGIAAAAIRNDMIKQSQLMKEEEVRRTIVTNPNLKSLSSSSSSSSLFYPSSSLLVGTNPQTISQFPSLQHHHHHHHQPQQIGVDQFSQHPYLPVNPSQYHIPSNSSGNGATSQYLLQQQQQQQLQFQQHQHLHQQQLYQQQQQQQLFQQQQSQLYQMQQLQLQKQQKQQQLLFQQQQQQQQQYTNSNSNSNHNVNNVNNNTTITTNNHPSVFQSQVTTKMPSSFIILPKRERPE